MACATAKLRPGRIRCGARGGNGFYGNAGLCLSHPVPCRPPATAKFCNVLLRYRLPSHVLPCNNQSSAVVSANNQLYRPKSWAGTLSVPLRSQGYYISFICPGAGAPVGRPAPVQPPTRGRKKVNGSKRSIAPPITSHPGQLWPTSPNHTQRCPAHFKRRASKSPRSAQAASPRCTRSPGTRCAFTTPA